MSDVTTKNQMELVGGGYKIIENKEREGEREGERGGEREGERERTISKITSILLKTPKLMIQIKFQI